MLDFLQNIVGHVLPFLFVLTLVVTVHELGHFLVAKACGVAIDRFSIGFGRAIFSRRDKSGVEWRIGWIPLGGYVMFAGDKNAASVPDQEDLSALRADIAEREGEEAVKRYFYFKPIWQRMAVTAAGPVSNFLLAIFIFTLAFAVLGQTVVIPKIAKVTAGSPAAQAGFQPGDVILQANGRPLRSFQELNEVAQLRVGVPTAFVVQRGDRQVDLTATSKLQMRPDESGAMHPQGTLGLQRVDGPDSYIHVRYGPVEAFGLGVGRTWHILETTVYYMGRMITGQVSTDQLGGPLRIAQVSQQAAAAGAQGAHGIGEVLLGSGVNLLGLAAVLSVGIGFMNLLPIPVLDGGHLLFYAYEALARRPLAAKVQAAGYRVGLALVLGLMLFATWNDLQQLRVFKFLGGLFS
jgi:regulator of sigma E protease